MMTTLGLGGTDAFGSSMRDTSRRRSWAIVRVEKCVDSPIRLLKFRQGSVCRDVSDGVGRSPRSDRRQCMSPDELLPQVYDELRRLAQARLATESPGVSLDATGLVHEVWIKLGAERSFASKGDYLMAASQAMRRILVDRARARKAAKRSYGRRVDLDADLAVECDSDDSLEAIDDAINKLALIRPRQAELVTLRRFGGLTLAECAQALGISERTADLWWAYARAWLAVELAESNR